MRKEEMERLKEAIAIKRLGASGIHFLADLVYALPTDAPFDAEEVISAMEWFSQFAGFCDKLVSHMYGFTGHRPGLVPSISWVEPSGSEYEEVQLGDGKEGGR